MSSIILDQSAIDKLMDDPKVRQWREEKPGRKVPLLYYYCRSYMTLHDGTVIEHGDGFMLTFVDPKDARDTKDIIYETVAVADGLDILVGGDKSVLSGNVTIGWSNGKYTLDPPATS